MRRLALLTVLGVMAIAPASASAAGTINVNTDADGSIAAGAECGSGETCTLRSAVEVADERGGETTIVVPAGTYTQSGDELAIEGDSRVTIQGAGAGNTTIAGSGSSEVFWVQDGNALTLDGVTVTGGSAQDGGGIYVDGDASLLVQGATVSGNHAAYEGGGIYGEESSSVSVRESAITGNEARSGGGIGIETEDNCEETEDYAAPATRAAKRRHARAAASPALTGEITRGLTVSRSTIEDNTARDGLGGGIFNGPCLSYYEEEQHQIEIPEARRDSLSEQEGGLTIEQSTIAGNLATLGESADSGIGGGIYDETLLAEDPIVDSTITGNTASETGGGIANAWGEAVLVSDTVAGNAIEGEQRDAAHPAWQRAGAKAKRETAQISEQFGANIANALNEEARTVLRNTIVANPGGTSENCQGYVESLVEGAGHNLDYPSTSNEEGAPDTCGMSEADHDLVGVDPVLDQAGLQDNGGPTKTIALLAASPAIGQVPISEDCEDEGDGPALPGGAGTPAAVDQRGEPRPGIAGKGCDIGAYEYQQPVPANEVPPTPTQTSTTTPSTTTTTTDTPSTQVLGVKIASPVCSSKRDITIHIQNVQQFGVVEAVVSVDGKARRTLTGRSLKTAINLVGLPKGTFTVSILARTRGGQTLHGRRVYHTCHTRLPGHLHLRL